MKFRFGTAFAGCVLAATHAAWACNPLTVKDVSAATNNMASGTDGGGNCYTHSEQVDSTGAAISPAAASLADATANPTAIGLGSYNFGYNGTTWDRLRSVNTGSLKTDLSSVAGTATLTGGVNGSQGIGGLSASGATQTGNPVKVGGVFNTTQPTVTTGQAVDVQATARGAQIVATGVDAFTIAALPTGANIIGKAGIDQTTDITTNGVEIAPTAGAAAGIANVASSAVESSHVMKASAGNMYDFGVQNGATAGCVMVFNATSAPVDGAVTPAMIPITMSANSTIGVSFGPVPAAFTTGITLVYSSTCGLTKTASATALFSARFK